MKYCRHAGEIVDDRCYCHTENNSLASSQMVAMHPELESAEENNTRDDWRAKNKPKGRN